MAAPYHWVDELKVGDEVLTFERLGDEVLSTKSVVTHIDPGVYVETHFTREHNPAWAVYDRIVKVDEEDVMVNAAYKPITQKNYFSPDGSIGIERMCFSKEALADIVTSPYDKE